MAKEKSKDKLEIQEFDPRKIKFEKGFNPEDRGWMSPKNKTDDEELKNSISEMGLSVPPIVVIKEGQIFIRSGHRRLSAIMDLINEGSKKFKIISCIVEPANYSKVNEIYDLINSNSGKRLSYLGSAEVLKRLLDAGESLTKLKEVFGDAYCRKRLIVVQKAPIEIIDLIKEDFIEGSTVAELYYKFNEKAWILIKEFRKEQKDAERPLIATKANIIKYINEKGEGKKPKKGTLLVDNTDKKEENISKNTLFHLPEDFVKKIIKNTIETYSGQWRFIHEAIQNSQDAIQQNSSISKGKIEIELYLGSNRVIVKDNGTGISPEKFSKIFLIGGGDKDKEVKEVSKILKGSQGVGIKSTIFTSENFKISSIHDNKEWKIEINNCYNFEKANFDSSLPEPKIQKSSEPTSTVVEYRLNDFSVEDFLNEVFDEHFNEVYPNEPEQHNIISEVQVLNILEIYFTTKTYLGCVGALFGSPGYKPIDVILSIHLDSKSFEEHERINVIKAPFLSSSKSLHKVYEHTFKAKYFDFLEKHNSLPKHLQTDKFYDSIFPVIENKPRLYPKALLVQKFDKDQAKKLLWKYKWDKDKSQYILVEDPKLSKRHENILKKINGIYLVISKRKYLTDFFGISPKQQLSVNGLPTMITLNPPRGALGYLNNVHILIDIDTTLGYGKKNISSRTMGSVNSYFIDIWNIIRSATENIVGFKGDKDFPEKGSWNKEEEIENFNNKNNIMKLLPYFLRSTPREEQEVIALFFELIGRKILKGYFPFRLGVNSMYDGLFYINEDGNNTMPKSLSTRQLKTIEFKYQLSGLINDFNENTKLLEEIDLVICWINDCDEESEYNISSLERDQIPPLPGASLRIHKGSKTCQVIVLKDFIESLESKYER